MGVLSSGKSKITIRAESEQETVTNTVAQYPIQRGQPIVDHTQRESKTWSFDAKLYGKNQKAIDVQYQKLLDWQFAGTLLKYNGAVRHSNIIISELSKTYDDGGFKNAMKISISLTAVWLVKSSFTKAKHVGPKKAKSSKKAGKYVTVRAGNTYWGWWVKYGTSINTLRKWNKWPDRRIPIGAKARVK